MRKNSDTVEVKISRIELCDLLIATTTAHRISGATKWQKLHDKLESILNEFDEVTE